MKKQKRKPARFTGDATSTNSEVIRKRLAELKSRFPEVTEQTERGSETETEAEADLQRKEQQAAVSRLGGMELAELRELAEQEHPPWLYETILSTLTRKEAVEIEKAQREERKREQIRRELQRMTTADLRLLLTRTVRGKRRKGEHTIDLGRLQIVHEILDVRDEYGRNLRTKELPTLQEMLCATWLERWQRDSLNAAVAEAVREALPKMPEEELRAIANDPESPRKWPIELVRCEVARRDQQRRAAERKAHRELTARVLVRVKAMTLDELKHFVESPPQDACEEELAYARQAVEIASRLQMMAPEELYDLFLLPATPWPRNVIREIATRRWSEFEAIIEERRRRNPARNTDDLLDDGGRPRWV